jgi:hypothetical protein
MKYTILNDHSANFLRKNMYPVENCGNLFRFFKHAAETGGVRDLIETKRVSPRFCGKTLFYRGGCAYPSANGLPARKP